MPLFTSAQQKKLSFNFNGLQCGSFENVEGEEAMLTIER